MSKYRELFSYQTLSGMAWASIVIDTETGIPYTAVFQQMNMGGAYYDLMHKLGDEITYELIYNFALKNRKMISVLGLIPKSTRLLTHLTGKILFELHPQKGCIANATRNQKCNFVTACNSY